MACARKLLVKAECQRKSCLRAFEHGAVGVNFSKHFNTQLYLTCKARRTNSHLYSPK